MSMSGMMTEALEMQRQMCDEAMNLVKQGTAMQNAQPPNVAGAEASLTRAVDIMEQALSIRYNSAEEKDAAERLNNKMLRYVKMIKSQRAKNQGGGAAGKRQMQKHNILELENLPEIYAPVMHLLHNSQALGDIFESLKQTFGFQESNALNQKEHLLLLLTNFKEQADSFDDGKKKKKKNKKMTGEEALEDYMRQRDPQQEMDLANKGIKRFHTRLFANYVKWCKYVSKKPAFTSDPLVDVSLFFLIWGEAGNFRQTPELLCFLLHSMLPQATSRDNKESGWFLANVIRPMYVELKRDNDKKTSKGERAPHAEIRNYDDFNEFFWSKKCLKYDIKTIGEAFANVDKKGRPKIVKKTYKEKRTWIRAVITFRRIFFFNCALFLATLGFAMNMVLFCPDSPIMYGQDIQPLSETDVFEILGKKYAQPADTERVQTETMEEDDEKPKCLPAKLATCLGVGNYNDGETFAYLPIDFRTLLAEVPFTNCLEKTSGRCACYHKLIDTCWSQADTAEQINEEAAEGEPSVTTITYDQIGCYPDYKKAILKILDEDEGGYLNCGKCRIDINSLIGKPTRIVDLLMGLIDFSGRKDKGIMAMAGGVGALGLVIVGELVNRFSSGFSMGFVGRSLPVPMKVWCRYTCFWIVLLIIKLTFDYQFMMKALVEASLFIWNANQKDYLQYSAFMVQFSFHNIAYLFFLWIPAWMVFLYDAQIFYSILSVVVGSFAGFNMRIGELRSFRILRLTFKSIPGVFNKKIVPNIYEDLDQKKKKKANKKKKNVKEDVPMPERRFERISMSQGNKPLTVKAQKYSSLLEQRDDDVYNELRTPNGNDDDVSSQASRSSNLGSITGVSGAEFERTIPFAMAWNRCLTSLREADVISDRELNVLSYLIDSKDTVGRKLYPPAFLTAGKLDESIDIVLECHALYDKLKTDKKKKDKTLQKIEVTMRERLLKDDLRIESILGSYKFSSQVLRILLGEEHKELDECYNFIEEMASHQQILKGLNLSNLYQCRAACAELMKAILEVPKKSTESSIKFQRSLYKVIDTVEAVVTCLKKVLGKQENLVQLLNDTPLKPNSFFFPADTQHYASLQLQKIVNDEAALDIVSRAYQLLTVDNFDAEPRSDEGRRRLRFFANSLFMDMPEAKPIRKIRSLTVSTPYYNEIVMYSVKDLTSQNDDSIKLLYYLQTIYPFEWENLLERLQVKDMNEALKKNPEEVQLWASYRGQTLARTTRGMMYNEDAIRFLHWLEIGENEPMHQAGCQCNKCVRLNEMVALKFNYVCTCQIYGRQKDEQRQQAQDIDFLLKKHPSLRVAYVDGPKKVKDGPPKYFSVLIRAMEDKIVEVYRVELPGDPIVGEGKPENQNHAVIFSRGELLQCIDMNQDGYLEEYLKMPNLLSTMDRHTDKAPLTIIGFREHVFTGGVSNLASFMSIQELNFVSLGQRMLAINHVRQHYGHPDIFDKLFAMSTGGTAKASKGVNLSEDIFAGFNSTLRGGYVSHEEFIQVGKGRDVGMQQLAQFEAKLSSGAGECVISRDALRMATRLDFFRLQSWFYGNLGWYFTQTLTVFGVYFFIYGKVYMALSGLDEYFLSRGGLGIGGVLNTSWAIQFGFLLVVPVVAVVGVEQGFRHGLTYLLWNVLTLGPIFFTFQMGTRMNYFDRTLLHGGAKYRATGRGFTIKHEKFAELFRFYAFSHFYRGVELLFLLLVFAFYGTFSWCNCSWRMESQFYSNIQPTELEWKKRCYANHYQTCVLPTNQNYGIMSFSLWIISATWMWAPFFFNPSGLDWDKIIEDYNDWQNWLRTTNDSAESWFGWWSNELAYLEHSSWSSRMVSLIRKSRFLAVAIGMYLQLVYNVYFERRDEAIKSGDKMLTFIFAGAIVVLMLLLVCCGYIASRVTKKMTMKQRKLRKMKFIISCICMAIALLSLTVLAITNVFEVIVIILMAAYWFMHLCILRGQSHHIAVRAMARAYDRAVGWIVFGPVMFVAMFLPFIGLFQQRVMFNNAFTSGLEVSKLFAHDVAPAQVVKVKRVSKKKKQRDD